MHWEYTDTAAFHLPQNELKINALGIGKILSQLNSIYHKKILKSMHWENTVPAAFYLPQNELKINALGISCPSCIPFTTK
jgi:hypothetical protein